MYYTREWKRIYCYYKESALSARIGYRQRLFICMQLRYARISRDDLHYSVRSVHLMSNPLEHKQIIYFQPYRKLILRLQYIFLYGYVLFL